MTVRIGITGPIGCGKSTVGSWLLELGAVVVDADQVARDVVERGSAVLEQVVAAFGPDVLTPDGELDRARLGRIVFADAAQLAHLESIIHPAVRPQIVGAIESAVASGAPAVVIEAIKLVEGGLARLCDEVWLVTCSEDEQRVRLTARGTAPDEADMRIEAQGPIEARLRPAATRVIDTSGSVDLAHAEVTTAYRAATSAGRSGSERQAGESEGESEGE